jgi:hypothetical protein
MNPAQDTVPNPPPAPGWLKRRSARGNYAVAGLALVLGIAGYVMARAQTVPVSIPDKSFPES